jgi:ATP-dependent Clp protease protease subunit
MNFEKRTAIKNFSVPMVVERTAGYERSYDIYSRLLEDRIVFLNEEVNNYTASVIVAELLYLDSIDPGKEINFYINSPGGEIDSGMGIIDTINFIKSDVRTICVGMAASMGAMILMSGAKGKRMCLPHSEIMIHQPLGGTSGQATEIEIEANHIIAKKKMLNDIIAKISGKSMDEVIKATDRNNWMTPEEALEFGLIDEIINKEN